jgi:hypothetical protein
MEQKVKMDPLDKKPALTIRDLYPDFTEKELAMAEDNLERYLTLVLRIFERRELQKFGQLTENNPALILEASASNPQ